MFLSIIIPYYKCGAYIYSCLKSLEEGVEKCKSLGVDVEILIIDDCNDDNMDISLLKGAVSAVNVHIRVLRLEDNVGLSDARNLGVESSQGDYVFFLDSDDYINANSFFDIISILKVVNVDIIFFDSHSFTTEKDWRKMNSFSFEPRAIQKVDDIVIATYIKDCVFYAWRFIVKREVMKNVKFYSRLYMEDVATTPEILSKSFNLWYEPTSMVNYRIRSNSIMTTWNEKKFIDMIVSPFLIYEYLKKKYNGSDRISNELRILGYKFFYWAIQDARKIDKSKVNKKFYNRIKKEYVARFGEFSFRNDLTLLSKLYQKDEIIKWIILYYNYNLFEKCVTPVGNFKYKAFRKKIFRKIVSTIKES